MLLKVLLVPALFWAVFGIRFNIRFLDNRIVGGQEVSIYDYPYHVAVRTGGIDVCSGSIIAANKILTAAHCIRTSSNYTIRCGSYSPNTGGEEIKVSYATKHPNYDPISINNDVAVLTLEKSITRTNKSLIINLSTNIFGSNRSCWVSGWGRLSENGTEPRPTSLRAVLVKEITPEQCKQIYKFPYKITETMICFGNLDKPGDTCQGDSGGPLVDKELNEQVGVTSWGLGCARPNMTAVYANVAVLYDWIKSQ